MNSKKILMFIHNSSIALQMLAFLNKYNLKEKELKITIFVETDKNFRELKKEINFIFKNYRYHLIYIKIKDFNLFTLKNFFDWKKIYQTNAANSKYLENILKKYKINLNEYNEIFYSNEKSSKYINKKFNGKKIFFFHGIGDIKIFLKQNYLKEIKNLFFDYLNYVFNKVELTKKKSLAALLFKKLIRIQFQKENMMNIDTKEFNNIFKKFSDKKIKNINFKLNKNFILYVLKFPRFKVDKNDKNRIKYLNDYLNFQFYHVKKYINKNYNFKKNQIIIKTKNNISYSETKLINEIAKKKFDRNKIVLLTSEKNSYINAEVFALHKNCTMLISNFSTVDFLTRILNKKIKILQCNHIVTNFHRKNNFHTKKNVDIKFFDVKKYYKLYNFKKIK